MACFIVPTAEAVITTAAEKVIRAKENKSQESENSIRFSDKIKWLNNMLWGGSALLAFEHVWHGEVTPFFPFLTAVSNAADTQAMLHEMATSGTAMAALVTCAWTGMVLVSSRLSKRQIDTTEVKASGE